MKQNMRSYPHESGLRAYLVVLALTLLLPTIALADKLTEIPSKTFRMSKQAISLSHLSDIEAREIVTNGNIALINSGRTISLLKANSSKLEEWKVGMDANGSPWYGPVCATKDSFVIALQDFPEDQRDQENSTPRGGYRAGPKPNGFVIMGPGSSSPDRYLSTLTVTSRPPAGPDNVSEDTRSKQFSGHVQSCWWDGKKMVLGSYGSLGRADFDLGTIDLIEEDDGLAFSRFPLLVEASTLFVGVDEGGMGGTWLAKLPAFGKPMNFSIATDEDFDAVSFSALVRHQGKLIVGTSHGLFSLDEQSGHFLRFDFGKRLFGLPVTALVSHKGFLWVFMGEEWLRVDVPKHKAVRYSDSRSLPLATGRPFGDGWLLSGPSGVWQYSAKHTKRYMPKPSRHQTLRNKAAQGSKFKL